MFVLLSAAFFIWYFGSPKENSIILDPEAEQRHKKATPAALSNFVPPTIIVLNDSKNTLPRRNWSIPALEINAEAALAMRADGGRIYYNKNMEMRRPVASLTKLMTAIIVLENYNLEEIIKVPLAAVKREGSRGDLRPFEEITVRSLLDMMLIDSSNDAAMALADKNSNFVFLMKKKIEVLGLLNTHFTNPDGLDEDDNYSTAFDIAKIFGYLTSNYPAVLDILKTENMIVYSANGKIAHRLKNTNALLESISEIRAGKTGYTDKAGGSLALLISGFHFGDKNNIITIVLGSPDRFGESEKLIRWLKEAYIWN
ncbi:MAG: D-alanyl-D-alanine carboxypeptidase [Parcubacteria group bacterium]|nr:D-alanyl-D-alanine carboxypeptidase [Parcubacteria group bacterium]